MCQSEHGNLLWYDFYKAGFEGEKVDFRSLFMFFIKALKTTETWPKSTSYMNAAKNCEN